MTTRAADDPDIARYAAEQVALQSAIDRRCIDLPAGQKCAVLSCPICRPEAWALCVPSAAPTDPDIGYRVAATDDPFTRDLKTIAAARLVRGDACPDHPLSTRLDRRTGNMRCRECGWRRLRKDALRWLR